MNIRRIRDWVYGQWIAREIAKFHAHGGKVVMITGSYGKTSVRELTYDLLRQKYRVLETSRNYNTAVGIAKTLYWELIPSTEWLIVEVGAYQTGEIAEFAKWVKPEVGVMTGIARQHLTRFGSWDKIKQAKIEMAVYIQKHGGVLIVNGGDETIKELIKDAVWYQGNGIDATNKNGARAIVKACGMNEAEIKKAETHWRQVPSRFEITTERYGMKVIDDSYNSNEKTFVSAVSYLGKQNKYTRILVTPGLLELGRETAEIHRDLGKQIKSHVDYVMLVGKNERTDNLAIGIDGHVPVVWLNKTLEFGKAVKAMKLKKEPLVLIENDIPEELA